MKTIYADAAASSLKTQAVIDAEVDFLTNKYANAGRGICARAVAVDSMVAETRRRVADFIGAADPEQVIFTGGATDGLNRVARTLAGRRVIVSDLDHHSARLPFEKYCQAIVAPLTDDLQYDWAAIRKLDADAIVITAMSNVLGAAVDIPDDLPFIKIVDASQLVIHKKLNAAAVDFMVFSGHKIGADTGLGILYQKTPGEPVNFGGGSFHGVGAAKYESGTLPLTQIAGLGAAIENLRDAGDLTPRLREKLAANPKIKFISGPGASLITFNIDGAHFLDVGAMLGARGICVRAGHHCATWLHKRLGIEGSVRISLGQWNTADDVDAIAAAVNAI
ncbi:MAG: aminotransferase class V-fold PLP-dependent enzyme [Rickettsiales bacterium]|jgi:selenocysteine lyase/cysteine desulfurase|nr:aminotransferase class V-fold PLP-dependent enzyme [Rickettsiales bacterium]